MLDRPGPSFNFAAIMQDVQAEFPHAGPGIYYYDPADPQRHLTASAEADRTVRALRNDFPKTMGWLFASEVRGLLKRALNSSGACHYPIPGRDGRYFAHYLKPQIPGTLPQDLLERLFGKTLQGQDIPRLTADLEALFTYHDLGHLLDYLMDPERTEPGYLPPSVNSRRWKEEKIADAYAVLHFSQASSDLERPAEIATLWAAGRRHQAKTQASPLYDTASVIDAAIIHARETGLAALRTMNRREMIRQALVLAGK